MKYTILGLILLLLPPLLVAQSSIPPGTILPLRLETGLNAHKLHVRQIVRARVMQNIPGTSIHRGAQVLGHVVSAAPDHVQLRFDTLLTHGQRLPLRTNLRAVASMLEVEEAQIPEEESSRGLTPETWTTQQIGGDQVYRGGGPVARGLAVVGEPVAYGVRDQLTASGPCRAAVAGNRHSQALWLFSSNACGAYGLDDVTIRHFGRTDPRGTIDLTSKAGPLNIRSGSGLLLRVQGS